MSSTTHSGLSISPVSCQHALSERLLERFILEPSELRSTDRRKVEGHLASCPECRRLEEMLRAFHAELETDDVDVPPSVDDLVDRLFSGPDA